MSSLSHPLWFLLVALAGWIHQQQRDVIDHLQAENRVLREQLGRGGFASPTISAFGWPLRRSDCLDGCSATSSRS